MLICPRIAQHCHEMQTNVLLVKKSCQTGEENWDISFSSNIEMAEMKTKKTIDKNLDLRYAVKQKVFFCMCEVKACSV